MRMLSMAWVCLYCKWCTQCTGDGCTRQVSATLLLSRSDHWWVYTGIFGGSVHWFEQTWHIYFMCIYWEPDQLFVFTSIAALDQASYTLHSINVQHVIINLRILFYKIITSFDLTIDRFVSCVHPWRIDNCPVFLEIPRIVVWRLTAV